MQILDTSGAGGRAIDRFSSHAAHHAGVARVDGAGAVGVIRIDAGGVVGRHPAVADQLFCVMKGSGWVSGDDGERSEVRAGQAALWRAGEDHESGTEVGLTALVIEIEHCHVASG